MPFLEKLVDAGIDLNATSAGGASAARSIGFLCVVYQERILAQRIIAKSAIQYGGTFSRQAAKKTAKEII